MRIKEEIYLGKYPTIEALEADLRTLQAPDATRTQWIGDCPRKAEYAIERGIAAKGEFYPKVAGVVIHGALAVFYTTHDQQAALETATELWGDTPNPPSGNSYAHITLGHLEVILKRYFDWAATHDMFTPIVADLKDLELGSVRGAIWRLTEDGKVVLGESKIVMEFELNGEKFLYSGIPDLPVEMGGAFYIIDHKSTNAYLSEWWAEQHRFSNQLRGYCAMIERLTGLRISGALINGVYMGEKASSKEFKGNRVARFGPYMYSPAHYDEAILNQYYWRKMLDVYKSQGYYPQHASRLCSGCSFAKLCEASPTQREALIETNYVDANFHFLRI